MSTLATNRKAKHDYFIEDTLECGIELHGTEVKSIRAGQVSLKEAWCEAKSGELLVHAMHINEYELGNRFNHDPLRIKKLLAHKREINKLARQVKLDGYTLIPLEIYTNKSGRLKLKLGICKGKHSYDKRQATKERDIQRDIARYKH